MKNRAYLNICLAMPMFLLMFASTVAGGVIFVDADASGANNGSSWAHAYNYLQDALANASSSDEIRVAQGIYKPDHGGGNTPGSRHTRPSSAVTSPITMGRTSLTMATTATTS
ncbi:MAG: hypothetical protein ACYSU3_15615 [Planctomycetota bacterium]|jgi:hypothetical protein